MTGREKVLNAAREAVLSDRNAAYGPPEDNFRDIAEMWATFLKGREGSTLNAVDVAAMLILMKVARMRATPTKLDHWVDAAGYAACGADCFPKEEPNIPKLDEMFIIDPADAGYVDPRACGAESPSFRGEDPEYVYCDLPKGHGSIHAYGDHYHWTSPPPVDDEVAEPWCFYCGAPSWDSCVGAPGCEDPFAY